MKNPATPPAMMMRMGFIFVHIPATNATAKSAQLFQSGKFSGVIRMMAAAPISPATAGRSPFITP